MSATRQAPSATPDGPQDAEDVIETSTTLQGALDLLAQRGVLPEILTRPARWRMLAPHAFVAMLASRQAAFAAMKPIAGGYELADARLLANTAGEREALTAFARARAILNEAPTKSIGWTRHAFEDVTVSSTLNETSLGMEMRLQSGPPCEKRHADPVAGPFGEATIIAQRVDRRGGPRDILVAGGEAGLAQLLADIEALVILTGGKPSATRLRHATRERFAGIAGCRIMGDSVFEFESHEMQGRQQTLFDLLAAAYAPTLDTMDGNPSGCRHDIRIETGGSAALKLARRARAKARRGDLVALLRKTGASELDLEILDLA